MKVRVVLLLVLLSLVACSVNQQQKKSEEAEGFLTPEEQQECIEALSLYLNVDSSRVAEVEETSELFLEGMQNEADDWEYRNNILRIDSVMRKGIELSKQNKYRELLALLEKEIKNVHLHPNNLIDNELQLHNLMFKLYAKFYDSEEYIPKYVELLEFTRIHMLSISIFSPDDNIDPFYPTILYSLMAFNKEMGNYEIAIERGRELCVLIERLYEGENEMPEDYVKAMTLLSEVYSAAGMEVQRDSCIQVISAE